MSRFSKFVTLFIVVAGTVFYPSLALAQRDYDRDDFSTQADAQRYFERRGGSSRNNVDLLDADGDGIACEPYFGEAGRDAPKSPRFPRESASHTKTNMPVNSRYGSPDTSMTQEELVQTLRDTPISSRDLPFGFSNARLEETPAWLAKDQVGTQVSWELSGPAGLQSVSFRVFAAQEEAEDFYLDHTGRLQHDFGMTGYEISVAGFPGVAVADGHQPVTGAAVVLVGNVVVVGAIIVLDPPGIYGPDVFANALAEAGVLHLNRIGYLS